jgi:hypothetical protein
MRPLEEALPSFVATLLPLERLVVPTKNQKYGGQQTRTLVNTTTLSCSSETKAAVFYLCRYFSASVQFLTKAVFYVCDYLSACAVCLQINNVSVYLFVLRKQKQRSYITVCCSLLTLAHIVRVLSGAFISVTILLPLCSLFLGNNSGRSFSLGLF